MNFSNIIIILFRLLYFRSAKYYLLLFRYGDRKEKEYSLEEVKVQKGT